MNQPFPTLSQMFMSGAVSLYFSTYKQTLKGDSHQSEWDGLGLKVLGEPPAQLQPSIRALDRCQHQPQIHICPILQV